MYNIMIDNIVPVVNDSVVSSVTCGPGSCLCVSILKWIFLSQSRQKQCAGLKTLFPHSRTVMVW